MLRLLLMFLTIAVSTQAAGPSEAAPVAETSKRPKVAMKASSGASMEKRLAKRRGKRRGRHKKMVGWIVREKDLRAEAPARPSGNLSIYSINYKNEADLNIYNPDGSFNVNALAEINHVFKCRRSGLETNIDTRLLTVLSQVYDHFGKRIALLSGYRFQRRTTSYHFHGAAADIRVPGVDPRKLRDYVESLDAGGMGVGWYPKVGFVHVDVRPTPSYRWIDYSRSNPDERGKQLPRGFKRKAPES
jgi:uncharacterized protein YcbK (DUF882 family)